MKNRNTCGVNQIVCVINVSDVTTSLTPLYLVPRRLWMPRRPLSRSWSLELPKNIHFIAVSLYWYCSCRPWRAAAIAPYRKMQDGRGHGLLSRINMLEGMLRLLTWHLTTFAVAVWFSSCCSCVCYWSFVQKYTYVQPNKRMFDEMWWIFTHLLYNTQSNLN
jgi:hypothetical protein